MPLRPEKDRQPAEERPELKGEGVAERPQAIPRNTPTTIVFGSFRKPTSRR
jgi:hypothetical protein